ncbi:ABC transporter substrate-binding protein [Labrenzia sp. VG12]|uniref:substrate-binding periplasmic protein n=1 Tax=Labrenzia sp. VG12 TaxID=2021862 RepID=UPI0012FE47CC|nr:transporter substrate-binding domain-containing protein [Labrenzia sp. VG12]
MQAQERLVLATIENTPNGRIGAALLKAAYSRLDIEVDIYSTSGKRGLMQSSTGAIDGEVVRFKLVGDMHPTLLRVDVPLIEFAVTVFVNQADGASGTIMDLATRRVGHLAGAVKLKQLTLNFDDVWQAASNEELFGMLAAGHLEAVVSASIAGRIATRQLGLKGIEELDPPLERANLYHFLHEKHAHLVPKITQVLRHMRETGELQALIDAEITAMMENISSGPGAEKQ